MNNNQLQTHTSPFVRQLIFLFACGFFLAFLTVNVRFPWTTKIPTLSGKRFVDDRQRIEEISRYIRFTNTTLLLFRFWSSAFVLWAVFGMIFYLFRFWNAKSLNDSFKIWYRTFTSVLDLVRTPNHFQVCL